MEFIKEIEIGDDRYISYFALKFSEVIDLKRLKSLVQAKGANAYILKKRSDSPGEIPEIFANPRPRYFGLKNQTFFGHSDQLNGELPTSI